MTILRPDTTTTLNGVKINEYLLTKHNPNRIDMPSVSMEGTVIGYYCSQHRLDFCCKRNNACGAVYQSNC